MKATFQRLYLWSRKIHRFMMWITILFSIFVGSTGIILENGVSGEATWLLSKLDFRLVRQLHGSTGKWLILSLIIMTITGLIIWIYPIWVRKYKNEM